MLKATAFSELNWGLTHTQVVHGPKLSRKAAVKAAQAVARYAVSLSDHLPMLKGGENLVEELQERHTRAARYILESKKDLRSCFFADSAGRGYLLRKSADTRSYSSLLLSLSAFQ